MIRLSERNLVNARLDIEYATISEAGSGEILNLCARSNPLNGGDAIISSLLGCINLGVAERFVVVPLEAPEIAAIIRL